MEAGFAVLLADTDGGRLTPSVVQFREGEEPVVGRAASRMRALSPERTIYSAKRFMGLRGEDLTNQDAAMAGYRLDVERGKPLRIVVESHKYSPEEVSAEILKKLKRDAENSLGRTIARAVITVPAYFNDAQRSATKRAGELAGFTVERIVNEPTAAALAYGLDKLKSKSKIAVYDLGGGTFDVSILELNNGVFEVLATNGNTHLGGDDIDNAVIEHLRQKGFPEEKAESMARLREAAIDAKHRLSATESVVIEVPFLAGNQNFSMT